jgi:catalase
MPFPSDPVLMETAKDLVAQMQAIFGKHPGFRPAHAKGELLSGTFKPTPEAGKLSTAPHFTNPSTPVWVRFSNSTGIPQIPDTDGNADPRGIGIRFQLGDRKHTDIIAHSVPHFPTRTGAEFLQFLKHIASNTVPEWLRTHPETLAFVTYPKPPPVSFATQQFYGVNAFKLIDAAGKETFIRYHISPLAGVHTLDANMLKEKSNDYLFDELNKRIASGPIGFKISAQVAIKGDITDDNTKHWADTNPVIELGTFEVDKVLPENAKEQKYIIFDPIPRVKGVEPSADPLLDMRAALYLISGKERRAA